MTTIAILTMGKRYTDIIGITGEINISSICVKPANFRVEQHQDPYCSHVSFGSFLSLLQ